MSTTDDRKDFEQQKHRSIADMAQDKDLRAANMNLIIASDKHRYSYVWSWMGVPIIQRPADILVTQEVIWDTKPDVIIETGVARGGSMIFYAAMQKMCGIENGRVIGVDIDIRAHNRESIESHPMASSITLVEGSSIAPETLDAVRKLIPTGAKVMVVLDSNHAYKHVMAELHAYAPLVSPGMYLVVADTILGFFDEQHAPKNYSQVLLPGNEPLAAANDFLREAPDFERDALNGKLIMSSSQDGFLRRKA